MTAGYASLSRPTKDHLARGELADRVENGVPIIDFAVLRVHHDVLHPGLGISGDALPHHANVAAVPVRADRDREFGLGPVAAQARNDRLCLLRRHLTAVPTIADLDGASVCRLGAAALA